MNMVMRLVFPLFVALTLCAITGCTRDPAHAVPNEGGRIRVVATTGMVADLARRVGSDRVEVITLMGPGVDPHLYKPTPSDIRKLESAQLVLHNGLHLEGKMGDLIERLSKSRPVVAVCNAIPKDRLLHGSGDGPGSMVHDPHVWFDVSLWALALAPVCDALSRVDPSHGPEYRDRADRARTDMLALHARVRTILDVIPEERRVLVTAHDAFGYFGRAYDIEVLAVQGMSTESEASLRDINTLVNTLVSRRVPAIFIESSVSPKNIQALIEGARAHGHEVRLGGELFSDAMGAADTPEGTYEGMVLHNARTIAGALTPGARAGETP